MFENAKYIAEGINLALKEGVPTYPFPLKPVYKVTCSAK
jgi:hypothetical protein